RHRSPHSFPPRPPRTAGRRLPAGPRSPAPNPMPEIPPTAPTAAYLARPHEVHRVVLLYSGGLDTSVMLRWIGEHYDAEVIALRADLGQPAAAFEATGRRPLDLGAAESLVVDAREPFAHEYVAPAVRANARYQGGSPLFTALGRPLLARLACEV